MYKNIYLVSIIALQPNFFQKIIIMHQILNVVIGPDDEERGL
jgi:hypothetical protein